MAVVHLLLLQALQAKMLQAKMRLMLYYLMAFLCNPIAFNLRIPSFIVAFLRVRQWVVHYASM